MSSRRTVRCREQRSMQDLKTWLRKRGFAFRIDEWKYKDDEMWMTLSQEVVEKAEQDATSRRVLIHTVNAQLA